jgi:multiple sugar transport system substrate-binding protein
MKDIHRTGLYACGLVCVLAFHMPGCGGGDGGRTEIVFWAMGAEGENVQKLMPAFERKHPDIHVRVQMIPWNAAHEKLLTGYAGDALPDICQLGNTWVPEFRLLNAIEGLNGWITRSGIVKETGYFPGIWDTNVLDSVVYGIPWYVDTRVMFYRKDLLSRAGYPDGPSTWAGWFDASRKVRALAGNPDHYAMFFSTNNEWVSPVIMGLQRNARLLKDGDTRGNFSCPEFTAAMHDFHRFFAQGWAPVKTTQIINVYQAFAEGVFAMYISGPWNIGEFSTRLPEAMQDSWMTAPLPAPDSGIGLSLAGGSSLVMFSRSRHKQEVWKLIEYLSQPDVQLAMYRLTGDLPGRIEAWRDTSLAQNRYAAAFRAQLNRVVATPKIPEWEQIAQKVREYAELVSMDAMTVGEAMAALDRDVDVILEKRRWMVYGK